MEKLDKNYFDQWYNKTGGDPWGYDSSYVIDRLQSSVKFITSNSNLNSISSFIEFGAFNGAFTKVLRKQYPFAQIYCIEISEVALEKLRKTFSGDENIYVHQCDMIDFMGITSLPNDTVSTTAILLLECLYYLPKSEQVQFLELLRKKFPNSQVYFSAPVTGGKYYEEKELKLMLQKAGYEIKNLKVLTFSRKVYFFKFSVLMARLNSFFRAKFANQIIFLLSPV